jgi:hypothetical protein
MALTVTNTLRKAWLDSLKTAIETDNGTSRKGKLKIYSGVKPDDLGALSGNDLLADIEFNYPCSTVDLATGVLTFLTSPDALEDDAAPNSGNAAWARIVDSADSVIADCVVSDMGGSGDIKLNSVGIVQGGIVRLNSATITAGNG